MKRVMITGATGFIGRHCLPLLLARNYEVHAVSSKVQHKVRSNVHWHCKDLLNSDDISKLIASIQPTHLLHLAWYTAPGKYATSLENCRWVQASLVLMQAFALRGGKRLVMAGTCAEYDRKYGYCSEQITPLLPATLYGACKHSLQIILDAFGGQTGLSAAWGRIFFLYGPHEHPDRLVSSTIRSVLQGKLALCSHGDQIRDFLYVQDVADAFVTLLESDVLGNINIASGYPVTVKDVVNKIGEKLQREDLIQLGAIPTAPNDPPFLVADVSRLTDEVCWQPKYDLVTGLEQTIEWWRTVDFDPMRLVQI